MNISEYDNKIVGIPEGIMYGQFDCLDEINNRMKKYSGSKYNIGNKF
jgi:hypothetical protein